MHKTTSGKSGKAEYEKTRPLKESEQEKPEVTFVEAGLVVEYLAHDRKVMDSIPVQCIKKGCQSHMPGQ